MVVATAVVVVVVVDVIARLSISLAFHPVHCRVTYLESAHSAQYTQPNGGKSDSGWQLTRQVAARELESRIGLYWHTTFGSTHLAFTFCYRLVPSEAKRLEPKGQARDSAGWLLAIVAP